MSALKRNNVKVFGNGPKTIMFAHGFGCDQSMWRWVAPAFLADYRVILFDQVGTGESDASQYSFEKYNSLQAYSNDILEICEELNLNETVLVGHSVAAIISLLAAISRPDFFSKLVMVAPSACYINREDYFGGFEEADLHTMLDYLNENFAAWAQNMAPTIMGNADRPELAMELNESFCRFHPAAARQFARLTFLSDNRADLKKLQVPALIAQCSEDAIAPEAVGQYIHAHLANSVFVKLQATGHCPNMSAPGETVEAIKAFIEPASSKHRHASATHNA